MNSEKKNIKELSFSEILSNRDQKRSDLVMKKMSLAKKIYQSISQKGMNQKEFAEILRKNPSEISKWLSGTHNFTIETIFEIERVLEINLLDWGGEETAGRFFFGFNKTVSSQSSGEIRIGKSSANMHPLICFQFDPASNERRRAV